MLTERRDRETYCRSWAPPMLLTERRDVDVTVVLLISFSFEQFRPRYKFRVINKGLCRLCRFSCFLSFIN